jgi:hypothetical protein
MLISIVLHLLLVWLLRWLPPYQVPELAAPVPIRLLQAPAAAPTPPPVQTTERRAAPKPPEPPPKRGGVLADLPKPPVEARPDDARVVSRFDSRAQDIGPGEPGTRKPSGQNPPQQPPELALPERYDGAKQQQARAEPQTEPQRAEPKPTPAETEPKQTPEGKPELRPALNPKERGYSITPEQELAMLQREQEAPDKDKMPHESLAGRSRCPLLMLPACMSKDRNSRARARRIPAVANSVLWMLMVSNIFPISLGWSSRSSSSFPYRFLSPATTASACRLWALPYSAVANS